ncbi:hypothetical protein E4U57_001287 [Claviceps arundinis]|uniref:Subtelomeric hrmA-associated cluster protein AFUB-079030/YDR124W-like helical bundle domain-containing protein n=1 Tax=Claviceps arundinis TaxID=1623583 RepID=A0ABQ7PB74_9HYPO|nr:hypothetical protein E4U57_001287 [Claviceps arundinis]
MVRDWQRDTFPRQQPFQHHYCPTPSARHPSFQADRFFGDATQRPEPFQSDRYSMDASDTGRFQDTYDVRRQPPMVRTAWRYSSVASYADEAMAPWQKIDEALRSYCGIAAQQYFVAAFGDDGKAVTFISPGHTGSQKLGDVVFQQFFDINRFQQVMTRLETGVNPMLDDDYQMGDHIKGSHGRARGYERRSSSFYKNWTGSARPSRKRARLHNSAIVDDETPIDVTPRRRLKLSDGPAVWNFYEQRFKNCQQTACKLIAKAWVKAVEPKKQSTHPYTGSDEKAPEWWPKPWGATKDDKVRHKEPDHLYKRERVHLLAHILRLVIEPNEKQEPCDVRKLGLNVKKLEEITYEALSSFFLECETNAKKRPYLAEIFKVARQEERHKNGELDRDTEVFVMAEDKFPDSYFSDNEDGPSLGENGDGMHRSQADVRQQQCLVHTPTTGLPPTQGLHGGHGPFMSEVPIRDNSYHSDSMTAEIASQPHPFENNGGNTVADHPAATASNSGMTLDMVPSPHDNSRRQSVFSDYSSPVSNNLYGQQWQQTTSAGPSQAALYSYTPPQVSAAQTSFIGSTVSMNTASTFLNHSFEDSERSEYDTNGGASMFRAGDMTHSSGPGSHQGGGYYVPGDPRSGVRMLHAGG